MVVAPIGAFGAMAYTIGNFGLRTLLPLGRLMLDVYLTMALFVFVVLGGIAAWGFSLLGFLKFIREEILLVLGTSSSEAALPRMLEKLERYGCARSVVGLVIPAGYSFNLDGTSIYLSMAVIFLAQVFNVDLSLGQQLTILGILMITSKGAAGVTGSGFIVLASTLSALRVVPVEGLALLLGVDRFMSEARAIVNLIGNGVATVVIAKSEGAFDEGSAWPPSPHSVPSVRPSPPDRPPTAPEALVSPQPTASPDDRTTGATATSAVGRNLMLRALPPEEYAQLLPHLEPFVLEPMQLLAELGDPIPHVYFPETGIVSLLSRLADGTLIENGTVGSEGMAGVPLLLGVDWTPVVMTGQVPGLSRRVEAATFRALLPTLPVLETLLRRYVVYFLAQVSQSLACNSAHTVEQRCARWLLMTHDRVPGDQFVLTHEVLAQMLAVRRAGVSVAADAMRTRGLIQYSRGRITITDRAGLEAAACECYGIVRRQRDALVGPMAE
jgi:CRP-like cAMP-binding protein